SRNPDKTLSAPAPQSSWDYRNRNLRANPAYCSFWTGEKFDRNILGTRHLQN
ncbi:MAG: hypothetical protein ACI9G5_002832, partial [Paracoccaceae bacterium]